MIHCLNLWGEEEKQAGLFEFHHLSWVIFSSGRFILPDKIIIMTVVVGVWTPLWYHCVDIKLLQEQKTNSINSLTTSPSIHAVTCPALLLWKPFLNLIRLLLWKRHTESCSYCVKPDCMCVERRWSFSLSLQYSQTLATATPGGRQRKCSCGGRQVGNCQACDSPSGLTNRKCQQS